MNPLTFCVVTETCDAMFGPDTAIFVLIVLSVILLGMLTVYAVDFLKNRNKGKKMHR